MKRRLTRSSAKPVARLVFALVAVCLSVAAGVLALRKGVSTDLFSMVGGDDGLLGTLAEMTAGDIRVLCADESRAARCRAVFPFTPAVDFDEMLDCVRIHGDGLLSAQDRALLRNGEEAKLRRGIKRRDYSGVGLFPKSEDPCYFRSDFVTALRDLMPAGLEEGEVLLTGKAGTADPRLKALIDLAESDDGIWLSGAPFHSYLATESSKREINVLGVISLFAVILLGWLLFRGFRFVLPTVLALGFGFAAGTCAVFAFPGRPHVLTFLFGTTLVGLGVDYCYHALAEKGRTFRRNLIGALLTTTLAFAPILFSGISVLRQMSVFTIVGLVAIALVTLFTFPTPQGTVPPKNSGTVPKDSGTVPSDSPGELGTVPLEKPGTVPHNLGTGPVGFGAKMTVFSAVLFLVAFIVLASGVRRVTFDFNPNAMYRPTELMKSGERKLQETLGKSGRFAVVKGADLQSALELEESAGLNGLSRFVPSLKRQRENYALISSFNVDSPHNSDGDSPQVSGVNRPQDPNGDSPQDSVGDRPRRLLTVEDLPGSVKGLVDAMVLEHRGQTLLVSPTEQPSGSYDGYWVFSPRESLEVIFGGFARETFRLLAVAFVFLLVTLIALYRRRFLEYVSPIVMFLLFTLGMLGWIGEPLNFFHLVCFFILAGLGVDYVIFLNGSQRSPIAVRVVFFSFLTSLVGFGLLAFTGFPVTRSMGLTLGIGLFFAYFVAYLLAVGFLKYPGGGQRTRSVGAEASDWSKQHEQSAGTFRVYLMWYLYRFLGKDAAKILFLPGWLFIYPWCRAGREALRQFYDVIGIRGNAFLQMLGFAWSMLDKTDACTLKKNLPKMTLAGDTSWLSGGCFLLSTHVGCIEVLPALRQRLANSNTQTPEHPVTSLRVHAFQQMGHDSVFTSVFTRFMDKDQLTLHAVEEIGVETAVEMQEAIGRGEIVLMAGDRLSAQTPKAGNRLQGIGNRSRELRHVFFGRDCVWPKGVFRFAKMMESPVYAIVCVKTGWNAYEVKAERLEGDLLDGYVRFLESAVRAHPEQWYQFYRFFG